MSSLRRPLLFSCAERYGVMALQLVTVAVIARLLTPAEIGIFMVGQGLLLVVEALRDFGASAYLIQAPAVTREAVRTCFTVTLGLSVTFTALVYGLSDVAAAFYDQAGLRDVLRITALGFLVAPFSAPIVALLRRDLSFGRIALASNLSALLNLTAAMVLAWLGFGYLSLAWAALATTLLNGILLVLLHPWPWWIFRPCLGQWRQVLGFGGYSTINGLLNVLYMQWPQLLLGRILGFDAVGLYSRAAMLCQLGDRLIMGAVGAVALPAVSRQFREGGDLKQSYLRALACNSGLQWPFLACLILLAEPLVALLLGPQWSDAVPLVRIGALAAMFLFPAFMTYPVLIGTGRIRDTLSLNLLSLPPSFALLAVAAPFGLEAVAASGLVIAPFQIWLALIFVRRSIPFTWGELAQSIRASILVTLCAAMPPAVVAASSSVGLAPTSLPVTLAALLGAAVGWLAGLHIAHHPLLAMMPMALDWRKLLGAVGKSWPQSSPRAGGRAAIECRQTSPGTVETVQ